MKKKMKMNELRMKRSRTREGRGKKKNQRKDRDKEELERCGGRIIVPCGPRKQEMRDDENRERQMECQSD